MLKSVCISFSGQTETLAVSTTSLLQGACAALEIFLI
jgi:hypothetical protein